MNLLEFVASLLEKLAKIGFILVDEKEINYGMQLKFRKGENEIPLNVYASKKKGISTVIGGSPKNPLRSVLQEILGQNVEKAENSHKWQVWAGTDESGKGDFFGPLVVCGFIVNENVVLELRKLGVKDSKLLKDDEIIKIAQQLYIRFSKNFEVMILQPVKYNELYENFRKQGKKLNEMLAWMHSRIILNLKEKHHFEGAVVDKFASDKVLKTAIKGFDKINLIHKIKAEEDIAVACASIIARYKFLRTMDELSVKYKLKLPKGASAKVIEMGKKFVAQYGEEKLKNVAKIHFKTREKIIEADFTFMDRK
ncbi:MAG: ribonuclease HIII [Candidatus Cloacimonetes bacterium]|jgi:ribonuclease HIII|nr:ribonuclease HIII [Candidatus Cloacimonadota bacterium]MBT7468886.1 ribonuclease HIII [Candidatus Cloacimonadota bacterium]